MIAFLILLLARIAGAACDVLVLLIGVRLVTRWWAVGVLWEFDVAGAPLLDRLSRSVRFLWRLLRRPRALSATQELALALLIVTAVRLLLGLIAVLVGEFR